MCWYIYHHLSSSGSIKGDLGSGLVQAGRTAAVVIDKDQVGEAVGGRPGYCLRTEIATLGWARLIFNIIRLLMTLLYCIHLCVVKIQADTAALLVKVGNLAVYGRSFKDQIVKVQIVRLRSPTHHGTKFTFLMVKSYNQRSCSYCHV